MALQCTNRSKRPSTLAERFLDMEIRLATPENAQVSKRDVHKHFLTPREHHYVRNHHPHTMGRYGQVDGFANGLR